MAKLQPTKRSILMAAYVRSNGGHPYWSLERLAENMAENAGIDGLVESPRDRETLLRNVKELIKAGCLESRYYAGFGEDAYRITKAGREICKAR